MGKLGSLFKDSQSTSVSRLTIVGGVALVIGALVLLNSYSFRGTSPDGYQKAVNVFEGRKRVDQLCNELPRPNQVRLFNRSVEGSTRTHAVSYKFETLLKNSEVKKFYLHALAIGGWRLIENGYLDFEKNGQILSLSFVNNGYTINCSENV